MTAVKTQLNDELCRTEDDFVREEMRWVALLNTGDYIFQDDNRPGVSQPSAWLRLKDYCALTGHYIIDFFLRFRSHDEHPVPKNADAYYFGHAAFGMAGLWGADILEKTHGLYLIGHVDKNTTPGKIAVQLWKVPEIMQTEWPIEGGLVQYRPLDFNDPHIIGAGL